MHKRGTTLAALGQSGQSTVEYALVMAAFLSVVVGLSALGNMFTSGLIASHVLASASHHAAGAALWIADVFSF
jgi:Flp pilus assembly protein TadG